MYYIAWWYMTCKQFINKEMCMLRDDAQIYIYLDIYIYHIPPFLFPPRGAHQVKNQPISYTSWYVYCLRKLLLYSQSIL